MLHKRWRFCETSVGLEKTVENNQHHLTVDEVLSEETCARHLRLKVRQEESRWMDELAEG